MWMLRLSLWHLAKVSAAVFTASLGSLENLLVPITDFFLWGIGEHVIFFLVLFKETTEFLGKKKITEWHV